MYLDIKKYIINKDIILRVILYQQTLAIQKKIVILAIIISPKKNKKNYFILLHLSQLNYRLYRN